MTPFKAFCICVPLTFAICIACGFILYLFNFPTLSIQNILLSLMSGAINWYLTTKTYERLLK